MEVFVLCKSLTYLYKVYIAWANDQKYYVHFINIFIHKTVKDMLKITKSIWKLKQRNVSPSAYANKMSV